METTTSKCAHVCCFNRLPTAEGTCAKREGMVVKLIRILGLQKVGILFRQVQNNSCRTLIQTDPIAVFFAGGNIWFGDRRCFVCGRQIDQWSMSTIWSMYLTFRNDVLVVLSV